MTSEQHKGKSGSELALLAIELTLSTAAKEFWSNPEFRNHMPVNRDHIWKWKNSLLKNKEIYKCGTHLKNKKFNDPAVSHSEKSMERLKLKIVTQGKYLNRSLVFHIEDTLTNKHYETYLNNINSKSFNLR